MSHEKIASTFDEWAAAGRADSMQEGHSDVVEQVLSKLQIKAGETILDLGCGNGWATRLLAKSSPGVQAIGIDLSPAMIARAEELHSYTIRARYEVSPFEKLEFNDGHFTRVFSMEAIYYSPDIEAALSETYRVLAPGGCIDFVIDFHADNPGTRVWADHVPVSMHYFSAEEWKAILERFKFKDVAIERVVDSRGPGDEASFEPSKWAPDWDTKKSVHAAGSLWMHAAK